ncbi:hypothetical protein [Rhizorhabdus sp.]|uniref:hypothetical protein n=1 Tax=Rhizorhabdus sp. TaxID=1968843 RepID=UPI0035AEA6A0
MRDYVDGALVAVPAGSTNGTPLRASKSGPVTIVIEVPDAASVTYAIAAGQPQAAPSVTVTRTGPGRWEEKLGRSTDLYITAKTGAPSYRIF